MEGKEPGWKVVICYNAGIVSADVKVSSDVISETFTSLYPDLDLLIDVDLT